MNRIWNKYSPLFHVLGWIVTMCFTAGVVWANISKYDDRITGLESFSNDQSKVNSDQRETLTRLDYNIQIIARKIGVKPLGKP